MLRRRVGVGAERRLQIGIVGEILGLVERVQRAPFALPEAA